MRKRSVAFIVVVTIGAMAVLLRMYAICQEGFRREQRKHAWIALERNLKEGLSAFSGTAGIVVKDLDKDWQITFNPEDKIAAASVVKVAIMASCLKAADEAKIYLTSSEKISSRNIVQGSGLLKYMREGTEFTLDKLITLMIAESDNTASNMLIERLGFDYINQSWKEFGMLDTKLERKMMDFYSRNKGIENYTSATDMALLLEKIYRNELLDEKDCRQILRTLKLQRVNDRIPARLPVEVVVAHKTGLERGVCHDAGIIFSPYGDFLIVVLTKGAASTQEAKDFIATVTFEVYNYLTEYGGGR